MLHPITQRTKVERVWKRLEENRWTQKWELNLEEGLKVIFKITLVEKRGGKSKQFDNDLKKILDKFNPENQDQKI